VYLGAIPDNSFLLRPGRSLGSRRDGGREDDGRQREGCHDGDRLHLIPQPKPFPTFCIELPLATMLVTALPALVSGHARGRTGSNVVEHMTLARGRFDQPGERWDMTAGDSSDETQAGRERSLIGSSSGGS
jgi:hypothetical protein